MKTKSILAAALGLMLSLPLFSQDDSTASSSFPPKIKKGQQGSSAKNEKQVIVINNGKVTINGKPIEDIKEEDLAYNITFGSNSNKACLGVITQQNEKGAKINSVTKESPAEKAGLKQGDIITKVGAAAVSNPNDLHDAIGKYQPGDNVNITYLRGDNAENTVTVKLGKNKEPQVYALNGRNYQDFSKGFNDQFKGYNDQFKAYGFPFNPKPKLGLQVQDLEEGDGVKITDVDDGSPAAKAGLKENDIITQINGADIKTVDDVRAKIRPLEEGSTYEIKYKRDGKPQNVTIKIPKKIQTADL